MTATEHVVSASGYVTERFPAIGGTVIYLESAEQIEISSLRIDAKHQGKGAGGELLRHMKRKGKRLILIPVAMDVGRDNDLMRFYIRHGFVEQYPGSDWLQWTP